jgi:2-polyprenyl-3-methyl-5-hydroxy-6-metoxy-1,4-benzoquinol methylase
MKRALVSAASQALRLIHRVSASTWRGQQHVRDDSQSIGFAVDVCHVIQEELASPEQQSMTLLDVGARTAAGSDLIARVFHPRSWSRLSLTVTAIDVDPSGHARAALSHPRIEYRVCDVFDIHETYDIVVCSHTLEHTDDPGRLLEKILGLARRLVVIAAPWKEPEASRLPYHLYTFDERFFERYPPSRFETYLSPHWSGGECFIAAYDRRGIVPRAF